MRLPASHRTVACGAIALLLAALYLGRLGGFPLQDPDEGRYAEIPREMLELHDLVTPRLDYAEYFEKPPLAYWLVAGAFRVLGTSEGAARTMPALAALGTLLATGWLGRRAFGARAAALAVATLATAPLFYVFSQALVIDMLLTLLLTTCFAASWRTLAEPERRAWPLLAAVAAALAVLAKGLIGIVLPALVLLVVLLLEGGWRRLRPLLRPAPVALFTVVVAPWFVVMSVRHPEFPYEFFVREHFARFATDAVGHPAGPLYYLPVLAAGLLPWTLLAAVLAASPSGRAAWRRLDAAPRRFLVVWTAVVVLFFSIARAKLAGYVLPALPPAMLLLGATIARLEDERTAAALRAVRVAASVLVVLGGLLVAGGLALPALAGLLPGGIVLQSPVVLRSAVHGLLAGGVIALAGGLVGCRTGVVRRHGAAASTGGLAVTLALVLLALVSARTAVTTSRNLADAIAREAAPGDLVVQYRTLMQGLPFYLRTRTVLAGDFGEVAAGAERAPDRPAYFWHGTERLRAEWSSQRRVFVATTRGAAAELEPLLVPTPSVVADDGRRVLLSNRASAGVIRSASRRDGGRDDPASAAEPRSG